MVKSLFEMKCWLELLYRQGNCFRQYLRRLEESGQYSAAALEHYHRYHLQKMIYHCYKNVPYYTDLFRQLNLRPESIQKPEDLVKLPFMDKQTVRENFDKLISRNALRFLCKTALTSGSTGSPGKFIRDYQAINFENAAIWRYWHEAGDHNKKRVTLRGDIVVPQSQIEPPFWKFNPARQELLMSGYHLSMCNSYAYIEKILEFQPEILYSYPSTAYLLAKFFHTHKIDYQFDAIFTSSEILEPDVRKFIEDVFQTRIYDWYGQAERVAALNQCKLGTYHIVEDYSLVETVSPDNGSPGVELVGTHLHNFTMPLIRYRTRDYVSLKLPTCGCGNAGPHTHNYVMPFVSHPMEGQQHQQDNRTACSCGSPNRAVEGIIGRNYAYIITPEGRRISITNHIPRGVENILETQFIQESPGEVVLKVLTNGKFTERDKHRLIHNTLEHTSPHMKVIVKEVANIPRGPNGKFISIINKIEARQHYTEELA